MGIPQYFGWLSRKYDTDIILSAVGEIQHFYFDFNCLIYHVIARMDYETLKKKNPIERRQSIIEEVLKYTKHVIETVKPKKSFTICIDGVVPMAKMHQQRLRRYKSPIFKEWENNIKKKYGVYQEELFDTNQITPGTVFMNELGNALKDAVERKYFGGVIGKVSAADMPGEGEHKIMNIVKSAKIGKEEKICIYGLDADLIMLSLTLTENTVVLVREIQHVDKDKRGVGEFLYVNVESLANIIFNEMSMIMQDKFKIAKATLQKSRLIKDYVFMGFLLGNDFLHHIPSLSIQYGGVDFVINLYANCYSKAKNYLLSVVNSKTRINNGFLRMIFENLEKSEESNLRFLNQKKKAPNPPPFDDNYSEEKWRWENVPYNPLFEKCFQVIDYCHSGWKKKYYQLYFDINIDDENDQVCLQNICKNYFDGIAFVARYYFDGQISWNWYNPYPTCPFGSDLSNHLKTISDINLTQLEEGTPFMPYEQLMMVLPKTSGSLLPPVLEAEMRSKRLERFYPDEFEWIAWERVKLFMVEPKLPELDIPLIRSVVRELIKID